MKLWDSLLDRTIYYSFDRSGFLRHQKGFVATDLDVFLRGKVCFVSSGGMYAKRLDVQLMLNHDGPYDGVAAYAMAKRAQVVLSELWAKRLAPQKTWVAAMHPGWAKTPGVEKSLP